MADVVKDGDASHLRQEARFVVRGAVGTWLAQAVLVVTGFILPRFINDHLGTEYLGLWDFGWSFVSWIALLQGGINSSFSRYVATYASSDQWGKMNSFLKTGFVALCACCVAVTVVTVGMCELLPWFFSKSSSLRMDEARGIITLFGMSVCLQFLQAVYGGTIAGCRRNDLLNGIMAIGNIVQFVGILGALLLGRTLVGAAAAIVFGDIVTGVAKLALAHRLCPHLALFKAKATWAVARDIIVFSGKTQLSVIARLVTYQFSSMVVTACLGPVALACFTRPRSLVLQVQMILRRFAIVLEPSVASLQARGNSAGMARLYVEGTRLSAYIALPMVLTLVIMADPIMKLWMGARYQDAILTAIIALGHLPSVVQRVGYSVLLGTNRHGRATLMELVASLVSAGLTLLLVCHFGWGTVGAAIALVGPMCMVNTFFMPVYGCRTLHYPLVKYLKEAFVGPVIAAVPFTLLLVAARMLLPHRDLLALLVGTASGSGLLAAWYWRAMVPESLKQSIRQHWLGGGRRPTGARADAVVEHDRDLSRGEVVLVEGGE